MKKEMKLLLLFFFVCRSTLLISMVECFSLPCLMKKSSLRQMFSVYPRRDFIGLLPIAVVWLPSFVGKAAVVERTKEADLFRVDRSLTVEEAKVRFSEARISLRYLLDNFDEISKGGGDNIRRYLGTVGTSSGMYGIPKVLKTLRDVAPDFMEYTESMSTFDSLLILADSAAYMAIFAETSPSTVPPKQYFKDSFRAAEKMELYLNAMAKELGM